MNIFWLVIILSIIFIAGSVGALRYFDGAKTDHKDKKEP